MSVAAEHPHKPELIDYRCVAVSRLRLPVSLEVSLAALRLIPDRRRGPSSTDRAHTFIMLSNILDLSPSLHLLVIHVKRLIRILNNERIIHGD